MAKPYALFDLDGTLVDSMPLWRALGRTYLQKKGVALTSDETLKPIETMTLAESSVWLARRFALNVSPAEVLAELTATLNDGYRNDVLAKPAVLTTLTDLAAQGVAMAVVSATPRDVIESCLTRLHLRSFFRFVLSCDDLNTSKRSPRIYLEAARRLGAAPSEVAVYEDALYALLTAKRAGFYTIAVYDPASADAWDAITTVADQAVSLSTLHPTIRPVGHGVTTLGTPSSPIATRQTTTTDTKERVCTQR